MAKMRNPVLCFRTSAAPLSVAALVLSVLVSSAAFAQTAAPAATAEPVSLSTDNNAANTLCHGPGECGGGAGSVERGKGRRPE